MEDECCGCNVNRRWKASGDSWLDEAHLTILWIWLRRRWFVCVCVNKLNWFFFCWLTGDLLADGAGQQFRNRRSGAPVRAADASGLRDVGEHGLYVTGGWAVVSRKGWCAIHFCIVGRWGRRDATQRRPEMHPPLFRSIDNFRGKTLGRHFISTFHGSAPSIGRPRSWSCRFCWHFRRETI